MDDPQAAAPLERAAAEEAAATIAGCASELSDLLGTRVGIETESVAPIPAARAVEEDAPIIAVLCKDAATPPTTVQILLPRIPAAVLAGLQGGKSSEELGDAGKEPLDPGELAALRGALKVFVAALGPAFAPYLEGDVEIQDAVEVEEPASDPTWLLGDGFLRIRYAFAIADQEESTLDVLLPDDGSEGQAGGGTGGLRLLIVDADPDSVPTSEISAEIGCEVEAKEPTLVISEGAPAFAEIDAVVVPWNAGGRPGIDLVESLQANPETSSIPIVMIDAEPTRVMVAAALGAGATSFVCAPIVASELATRLGLSVRAEESTESKPETEPESATQEEAT